MTLEKKSNKKTNYHLGKFFYGLGIGLFCGFLDNGEYNNELLVSIYAGSGIFPIVDKIATKKEWSEVYEYAPAQTAGIYTGLTLTKLYLNQ